MLFATPVANILLTLVSTLLIVVLFVTLEILDELEIDFTILTD